MVDVVFELPGGDRCSVATRPGFTLMEVAVRDGIEGILGDCGGACACATCHVYVEDKYLSIVGRPERMEDEMLETVENRLPNSRLACQIKVTNELDGIVLIIPSQG
jgi:2Fe-2S ferredoxin